VRQHPRIQTIGLGQLAGGFGEVRAWRGLIRTIGSPTANSASRAACS